MLVLQWRTPWQSPNGWHRRGTIKNVIFRKVKSGQIVVLTPKEFSNAAMKFVPSVITAYLPKSNEIVEPENIHQAQSIPETLSIHKFVRQISDRGDYSIEFFKTAVDQEAFHTQRYNKAIYVACGHQKSNKSNNECSTCRKWYAEEGSEWLNVPFVNNGFRKHIFTLKSNFKFSMGRKQRILYFNDLTVLHL